MLPEVLPSVDDSTYFVPIRMLIGACNPIYLSRHPWLVLELFDSTLAMFIAAKRDTLQDVHLYSWLDY